MSREENKWRGQSFCLAYCQHTRARTDTHTHTQSPLESLFPSHCERHSDHPVHNWWCFSISIFVGWLYLYFLLTWHTILRHLILFGWWLLSFSSFCCWIFFFLSPLAMSGGEKMCHRRRVCYRRAISTINPSKARLMNTFVSFWMLCVSCARLY